MLALVSVLGMPGAAASAPAGFVDHGVAVPVAESRGVAATTDANGRLLVIACSLDVGERGWILVTDVDSGETKQYFYPQGVPNSAPFASLMSRNGRFYTCAGQTLLEFDPSERRWLFHGVPAPSESCYTGMSLADGPDGLIYGGSYPNCHLISYDPKTQQMADYGKMDSEEHYLDCVVVEDSGWVYCGIGTARGNLVAFHPKTRERRQLLKEEERKLGTASVYRAADGGIYGRAAGQGYRLSRGEAAPVAAEAMPPAAPTGSINWGSQRGAFPDGRRLAAYNLPERYLEIREKDGTPRRIRFDYQSGGASLTSMTAGPDGRVHGSSCHPMHWFAHDPKAGKLEDWGAVPRIGGGNICAMAVQGAQVVGPSYAGGHFYAFDTTRAWNGEQGEQPNPRLLAQFAGDITRPRAVVAHPDGKHVIMAGFMGYGRRGGGMGIVDLSTGKSALLTHQELIPDQSTIALKALPNGDLVGGTSTETPGGGHPTEKEGVLYRLDWQTRKVVLRTVPVPGAPEVHSLEVGKDGLVYGLASGSRFFVFDLSRREVIHRADLSQYGALPRPALIWGANGRLLALLTNAILEIDPKTFAHRRLADTPGAVSAGAAVLDGRLYFAIGAHVWSYDLAAAK